MQSGEFDCQPSAQIEFEDREYGAAKAQLDAIADAQWGRPPEPVVVQQGAVAGAKVGEHGAADTQLDTGVLARHRLACFAWQREVAVGIAADADDGAGVLEAGRAARACGKEKANLHLSHPKEETLFTDTEATANAPILKVQKRPKPFAKMDGHREIGPVPKWAGTGAPGRRVCVCISRRRNTIY
jgi:hypothetical protein